MTTAQDRLIDRIGPRARAAARLLARASGKRKNEALLALADLLTESSAEILAANAEDVAAARAAGLPAPFVDRLTVTPRVVADMATGCRQIADLPDPIGEITAVRPRPDGFSVGRMRVPLGVVGMIYEARPNVTIDAAALAIKSGNAAILRGGSEASRSNRLLAGLVGRALARAGLPEDCVQVVTGADRSFVGELITATEYVDVIVPRGGKSLIARLDREARVPLIRHLDGICHTYVDEGADLAMAVEVCDNAKTQRCAPCNAMETLLVHATAAPEFLPQIAKVWAEKGVEMRCDATALAIIRGAGYPAGPASAEDWDTEYNDMIISIAVVPDIDAAIDHIERHGSRHTDAIITRDMARADRFLREVDSGSVMVNCSTRLADGFVYGLGAEIGISNGKLHARGPVGLEGLTSQKYVVLGQGHCRH